MTSSYQFNAVAARAYAGPNAQRPLTVRAMPTPPAQAAAQAAAQPTGPIGQIRPAQTPAQPPVETQARPEQSPKPNSDPSRLIAARVDTIDLSRDVATIQGKATPAGSYPLYRHPADRNMAATGVAVGRSLDVQA